MKLWSSAPVKPTRFSSVFRAMTELAITLVGEINCSPLPKFPTTVVPKIVADEPS
jgi:hypothetical protein